MIRKLRPFLRDNSASAGEFALILPLAVLFFFSIIDGGRYLWEVNRLEKATQKGARFAVATDIVASDLGAYSFAISGGVPQGETVKKSHFTRITCSSLDTNPVDGLSTSCVCPSGAPCAFGQGASDAAFENIVRRMATVMPNIEGPNVVVDYSWSGLGFSGDPNGPDVAPIVTIHLRNMQFNPVLTTVFGGTANLPSASYSLTMEDGQGTVAN